VIGKAKTKSTTAIAKADAKPAVKIDKLQKTDKAQKPGDKTAKRDKPADKAADKPGAKKK